MRNLFEELENMMSEMINLIFKVEL